MTKRSGWSPFGKDEETRAVALELAHKVRAGEFKVTNESVAPFGFAKNQVESALTYLNGQDSVSKEMREVALDKALEDLPATNKAKLEALVRRQEREFDWKVQLAVTERMKERSKMELAQLTEQCKELNKRLEKLERAGSKVLTRKEHKAIKMALMVAGTDADGNPIRPASADVMRQALEAWQRLAVEPLTDEEVAKIEAAKKRREEIMKKMRSA